MLIAICVAACLALWGGGLYLIGKALSDGPTEKFEELAPSYDTVTLNTDLEGLH